ncbi:uncharacterized protein LOC110976039 [Acanthaster planci]|uniref:Uncharacterized protein LOC110976039 n=1 Tax=Acanthaster planci TaxID=133434 RepID=A0A8B7XXA6_ACAPL|nr:uncharacterized protein LOC110976039 [Acanthaster planci]
MNLATVTFAIILSSLIHLSSCAPLLVKRSSKVPCLIDGDCLVGQRCYWEPWAEEPTGRCHFVYGQGETKRLGNLYATHHRSKRIRRSLDDGTYPGLNSQLQNPDGLGADPFPFPEQYDGLQPSNIKGGLVPDTLPRQILDAPSYRRNGDYGPEIGPTEMSSERQTNENFFENDPDARRIGESAELERPIHRMYDKISTTQSPQPAVFEYVVNDDNTHDTVRLNNDNDINLIHAPIPGYSQDRDLSGILRHEDVLKHGRGYMQNNAANGMEDDVDFADEIVHDPLELKAAAEGAAIRAGDDIPHFSRRGQLHQHHLE